MQVLDNLNKIFCEVFNSDEIKIASHMFTNDMDGWDYLSHVNLIIAIDTNFDISFNQKELLTFKKIGDLLDSIRSKMTTRREATNVF